MASFHIQINTGEKGDAAEHAQYIAREGRFTEERYGGVAARGHANFPDWAREDHGAFWRASDAFERANGNSYREYELALPRELSRAEQVGLVQRFAEQGLGVTRVQSKQHVSEHTECIAGSHALRAAPSIELSHGKPRRPKRRLESVGERRGIPGVGGARFAAF